MRKLFLPALVLFYFTVTVLPASAASYQGSYYQAAFGAYGDKRKNKPLVRFSEYFCFLTEVMEEETDLSSEHAKCGVVRVTQGGLAGHWVLIAEVSGGNSIAACVATCYSN